MLFIEIFLKQIEFLVVRKFANLVDLSEYFMNQMQKSNECLVAKIDFDTAEKEPSKV